MIDVKIFDPRMEFVRDLIPEKYENPHNSSYVPFGKRVYQVSLDGTLYVLKVAEKYDNEVIKADGLEIERKVLEKAREVEGITHLVESYIGVNGFSAVLKEYANGTELQKADYGIDKRKIKRKLIQTVGAFHNLGIAGLDIDYRDIIVSPDGKDALLVDFDVATFKIECKSQEYFKDLKRKDYADLSNALM